MAQQKNIYHFGAERVEGSSKMRGLLGGKGANLAEMRRMGFPIPSGFTLSTELCRRFYKQGRALSPDIKSEILASLRWLEKETGKTFAGAENPLLVSVRSGAPVSMPGMLDTILNLGLNDDTAQALGRQTGSLRFAYDCYRRFIRMYSEVALKMNGSLLDAYLEDYKRKKKIARDQDMKFEDWRAVTKDFKEAVLRDTGQLFPDNPQEQLWAAVRAVFLSWENPRARLYRQMKKCDPCHGTAVNVQTMVFGNMGESSASGVVFTRNPSTGAKGLFGEFLPNAQGEDIVDGSRTPLPIRGSQRSMERVLPQAFQQLKTLSSRLELHYKYIQDIEFTVEKGCLYLLQTRDGKCSAAGRLKILQDLVTEGVLKEEEALLRIPPGSLEDILHPAIENSEGIAPIGQGLPASPGAAVGRIIFQADAAKFWKKQGEPVILARKETSPEDISGMISSKGILTVKGGMTSHAAVVARSMGKPCIVGCEAAVLDESAKTLRFPYSAALKEGDFITLDGASGKVFKGALKTKAPVLDGSFFDLLNKADRFSRLKVLANADTPRDVRKAKKLGAQGVGLCRTEHMFFAKDRLPLMRKAILSEDPEERIVVLQELFPMQKADFYELLSIMDGSPVTIRLLDPPLHEFLPRNSKEVKELSSQTGWSEARIFSLVESLKEVNPMLGHRGCRLALSYPEIYLMQAGALAESVLQLMKERKNPQPEIMAPLVAVPGEMEILRDLLEQEIKRKSASLKIPIGVMLELPSACLRADELAQTSDFFSFGTNDLTQTTLGVSRDDSGKFFPAYLNRGVFAKDPFASIEEKSVGELIKQAVLKAKKSVKTGVCGESAGDPESIAFFHKCGLDYVSCSPYRIPTARLAAAQSALKALKKR